MPNINVSGAAARLLAFGTNTPGHCLEFVWRAISQGRVHYLTGGGESAYATWQATNPASRHNGDRNVPKDMPAYFGPRPGNALGDVIISNGDGTFTATDRPNGHIGICTLTQRGIQIGRPYLGWSETMGGYDLTTTTTAGSGGTQLPVTPDTPITPPPVTPKELDIMAEPIYIKGDTNPEVSAFYTNVSDAATPGPGAVFKARRPVAPPEFDVIEQLGFPHPKQTALIVIPQAYYDAINVVHP
jgi:hypothetical protein